MATSLGAGGDPFSAYDQMRRRAEEEMQYQQMAMMNQGMAQMLRSHAESTGLPKSVLEPESNPVLLLLK